MERGAFEDAMNVFQDAVYIMKAGVCISPSSPPPTNDLGLPRRLLHAERRVASPETCQVANHMKTALVPFVLLRQEDYQAFDFEMIAFDANQVTISPIRIENSRSSNHQADIDIDSSIMLSNLGQSYACLAKWRFAENRRQLQIVAARIFQMADSILYHIQTHICDEETDNTRWEEMVCINMVCLHGLFQVLEVRQRDDEDIADDVLDAVIDRFCYLQSLSRHLVDENILFLTHDMQRPHAAAA